MARALIIEDDDATAELLVDHLGRAGHQVMRLAGGEHALAVIVETRPELIVLDWMLPHLSGPEISKQVRTLAAVQPIIVMLTARGDELDVVEGFAAGIDDYVRKPFGVRELLCRFAALLRLSSRGSLREQQRVQLAGLMVDAEARVARAGEQLLDLTPKELDLLHYFLRHPHTLHSREELLQRVWGYHHTGYARTVDSHVTRLRRKLARAGLARELIVTAHRAGYRFEPPEDPL